MSGRSIRKTLLAPAIAAALLGAAMVSTVPVEAQQISQPTQREHPSMKLVSVDFAGGTTAQYYDALQKALGQNVVVIMPGAEAVRMPPVKLTNVPFGEAVQVAQYSQDAAKLDVDSEGQVWLVFARGENQETMGTKAWSLGYYLSDGTTPDALLSAVQAGLDLQGGKAQLKYHDETKVLFAWATSSDIVLINDTLNAASTSGRVSSQLQLQQQLMNLENRVNALEALKADAR